ncbi:MAG: hypothetical protein H0W82_10320 [Actinobacteria bacterium]|nr:hypothetical protein [Actinomycetota bacterium]
MNDRDHLEGDGPSPNPSDDDVAEEMEEQIEDMDRPLGAEDHTTASEQREGDTIDERLARETGSSATDLPVGASVWSEPDIDEEPQLVGDKADAGDRRSAEESAMHVRDDAPGVTDHPDDYVEG